MRSGDQSNLRLSIFHRDTNTLAVAGLKLRQHWWSSDHESCALPLDHYILDKYIPFKKKKKKDTCKFGCQNAMRACYWIHTSCCCCFFLCLFFILFYLALYSIAGCGFTNYIISWVSKHNTVINWFWFKSQYLAHDTACCSVLLDNGSSIYFYWNRPYCTLKIQIYIAQRIKVIFWVLSLLKSLGDAANFQMPSADHCQSSTSLARTYALLFFFTRRSWQKILWVKM